MAQRPMGVTVLAVLSAVGGALALIGGLAWLGLGGLAAGAIGGGVGAAIGLFVTISGVLSIVLGAIYLAFAYGAWTLQGWAWTLGVAGGAISLARSALYVLGSHHKVAVAIGEIIPVAIALAVLYYLSTPMVRRSFGRS